MPDKEISITKKHNKTSDRETLSYRQLYDPQNTGGSIYLNFYQHFWMYQLFEILEKSYLVYVVTFVCLLHSVVISFHVCYVYYFACYIKKAIHMA